jgi:uroporphyrinogen-III synthase
VSLLPLEGFVVGITADRRSSEQAELLERRGAAVVHAPTISTEYLGCDDALRGATDAVIARPPDFLVATTGIGMRAWFDAAEAWGLGDALGAALAASRVVARGPKAAAAVQVAGLDVWGSPDSERLADVVAMLAGCAGPGSRVAFQHYGRPDGAAVAAVAASGAEVIEVPVYEYRPAAEPARVVALAEAVCAGQVDAVTFTSAPALQHFLAVAHDDLLAAFNEREVVAACIGPVSAEVARAEGIAAPLAPSRGRLGLLVRELSDALRDRRRELRVGDVSLVVQGRAVAVDGVGVALAPREAEVLALLLDRQGAVLSKAGMLRELGGEPASEHALETTIARLRRRLGAAGPAIQVVRSRGYRIDAESAA